MKLLRLISKNAARNSRRTVLTILSITVSVFLVCTLQAILTKLDSLGQTSDTSNLRVIVHRATGLTELLPISYKNRILAVPGVKYAVGLTWFGGQYIDASNFFANFAADTENFEKVFDDYKILEDQLASWKTERSAALVGKKLIDQYHWQIGQRITLKGTIYPADPELIIRAVYTCADASQERAMYFHWDYLDEILKRPGTIGSFSVKVDSADDVPKVMDAVDKTFHNSDAETKTETEKAFNLSFVAMLGNVKFLLDAISLAVVFTILLVSGNTMAMSIRERTGEVAVLKTLGFRRNTILQLLVGESIIIALMGGFMGGVGAQTTYAFIGLTSSKGAAFGWIYALGVALLLGYGVWILFAGQASARGWMKITRYVVSALGCLLGLVAGYGFYLGVGFVMNQSGLLSDFRVTPANVALGFVIAAAVGLFSSAFPALRASRMSISEALRYLG